MMKRGLLIILFGTMYFLISAQNGVEDCFNGTFSLDDGQCAFVSEPVSPSCGPLRYYLNSLWRNPGLDSPTSLFLYTPFDSANVRIFSSDGIDGSTPEFEDNIIVRNGAPVDYILTTLSSTNRSVSSTAYNTVETSRGLIVESDAPLTAVYRLTSAANKSFFVLKGQEGLGYGFSAVSQTDVTTPATPFEAHFVSVMAIEDNTQVRFQKDNFSIEGSDNNSSSTNDIDITNGLTVTLNAGETYMIRDNVQSSTSIAGTLVTGDKPITVTSGSSHSRHGSGVNDRDAGMDQLIPINKVGEEYIAVRGRNITDIDYLILIGIMDNTVLEVNGTSIGTINAGEIIEYKLNGTGGEVFHVSGDNIFCAYHVSGVFDEEVGMAQLPAIEECSGNSVVDFALIGSDDHLVNVIIPNSGLSTLELNGSLYTNFTTAQAVSGTSMSVVTFDQSDLAAMGNRLESDELFHVGVTTGSSVGGSYGYLTKYGNELVLFDPADGVPLNVASFDAFVAGSVASTTGFSQDIGVISCTPPASIIRVNGNNSNFTTVNNGLVNFTGQQVNYTSSASFIGFEDLEVVVEDAAGQAGAVCIRIGVFQDEICGNGIDDDLDGDIDEQEECPTDPCLDDCNNTGCEPEIQEVFSSDPSCEDLTSGGIGILSSSQNVEYSINNGASYQDDASFFDLPAGGYNIIVRNKTSGCTTTWPNNPVIIDAPDCSRCIADAGDPRAKQSFCQSGNFTSVSVAPNTNTVIPTGFETIYVLTKEPDLLIIDYKIGNSNFNIPGTGNFRIHTLIAEVNNTNSDDFLDLSIVKKSQSTLIVIIQCISNHNVCAALDVKGTLIQILDESDSSCGGDQENTIRKCSDNTDNDSDGLVDCMDPDCQSFMICNEDNPQNCNDGIDNDGDGLIDCDDDECLEFLYCDEDGKQCNDGIDNDQDGLVDCADPNCADEIYCSEDNVITCCDGIDNDGDGRFDCDDTQCTAWLYCRERSFSACTDGIDNDLDGLVDCADPNCQALNIFQCSQENTALNCSDGIDNDEDGLTDCFDTQCAEFSVCDNDGDGLAGVLDINDNDPCIPFNSDICTEVDVSDLENKTEISFDLKVILEGPYDVYNDEMSKRLNERGYLPGQKPWTFFGSSTPAGHPYSGSPWNYRGREGASFDATIEGLDRFAGYDSDVVDWVLLSLRTNTKRDTEVYRTAALLHTNGSIHVVDAYEFKNLDQRGYYIVIEHRNHMAVMSTKQVLSANGRISYDFTNADSYNIGLGQGQKELANGAYGMIAGNPETTEGTASYTDVNIRDLTAIALDQGENSGYFQCDLDLDGDVNTRDKSICLSNNGMFSTLKF